MSTTDAAPRRITLEESYAFTKKIGELITIEAQYTNPDPPESSFFGLYNRTVPHLDFDEANSPVKLTLKGFENDNKYDF